MRAGRWLIFATLAASLLAPMAGAAEFEEKRFYVTPFAGWTFFDSERKFITGADLPNDVYWGGRAGVRLTHSFWFDVAGGYTPVETCCDWVEWQHLSGNLMWSPATLNTINPFLSVGTGWSAYRHSSGPKEEFGTVEAAGGLRVRLSEAFGLRLEARNVLGVPKKNWSKAHTDDIIVGAGLTFAFGGGGKADEVIPVEVDSDGDGVMDPRDRCPNTPRGCSVDADGCPADSDHDGVCNGVDRCPNTLAGCQVDATGCPLDSDGDGVCDGLDQCPNTASGATVDRVGCVIPEEVPREIQERETELLDTGMLRISDINFAFDRSDILPASYHTLDVVGTVLTKWPGLRIEIGGHTDSRGSDAYNHALSHRRAGSVRAYLLSHFKQFTSDQLTSKGYGESDPIVPNDSEAHMAKNRRVEFKVLNREVLKRDK